MKKTLTIKLALILIGCNLLPLKAQQAIGLFAGNHNAPYSAFQNPANTLTDLNRLYINFWGANVGFTNNALTYKAPFGLIAMASGNYPDKYKSGGNLLFNQDWISWGKTNNQKLYYLNEVYGPSAFFRVSNTVGIGFGVRNISGISMTGVNADLGKLFRFGLDSNGGSFTGDNSLVRNKKYSNGPFSINVDNYNEWFFSLAGATRHTGSNLMKWGATAKFLLGTGNAHIGANSLDYTLNANNQLQINKTDLRFNHTSDASVVEGIAHPLGLNWNEINGAGFGMDLGFVYEKRERRQSQMVQQWWDCDWNYGTQYDWKFGASITDLGLIGYQGSTRKLDISTNKNWNLNNNTINNWNANGQDRLARIDNGFFDSLGAGAGNNYAVMTPAALNAQLDMNLGGNFFFGINWSQSLKAQNSLGLRKASYLNFVPRWEGEYAEIGMPVTLTRDYTALNVGLYGRLGPVIVGTDNLAGLANFVANNPYKSANVYFGMRMALPTCGWYHVDTYDSIQKKDSVYKNDTVSFWRKDTIRITKHDTFIQRDTIVKTVTLNNSDLKKREAELAANKATLAKKEAEIAQKDADLKKREADVRKRENTNMGGGTGCEVKIADLEEQLRRERDLYAKLNRQHEVCNDDKNKQAAKIIDLENQIIALGKQNSEWNTQNNGLRLEIDRLKAEILRLKLNNNPCGAQVKTLDSLLALEQKKTADQAKETTAQKTKVYQLETEATANKKRIADLEAALILAKANNNGTKACEDKVKVLEADLAAEKLKSANLTKQLATVQGDKDDLQKENSGLKAKVIANDGEMAKLKKQLDDLRKEYDYEIAENTKLRDQLKNCGSTTEAAKLKADLDASNKKVTELTAQMAKVTADNDNLTKENSGLKAKVTDLEKEIADLKAKLDAQDKTIADLQAKLKNCGNAEELDKAKADLASANAKVVDLQSKVDALTKGKAQVEGDLKDAKDKIADLEDQLKKCKDNNCDDIKAELDSYKGKYNTLKEEYDALLTERNKFKADLDKCKSDLANCSGSASDEADKLKAEVAKLKTTIIGLNGEVAGKQKSLDDLQAAYDKLDSQNADLKKQIADLQGQVKSLNDKVADLQAKLKACQDASPGN